MGTADLSKAEYASKAAMLAALPNHAPAMKEKIIAEDIKWPTITREDLRHLFAYLDYTGISSRKDAKLAKSAKEYKLIRFLGVLCALARNYNLIV